MNRKPTILYYDHGQEEKRKLLEKGVSRMGFSLIPVLPIQFPQTVGYLAKVKGFPTRKVSPLEIPPAISQEVMVLCYFSEKNLDMLLTAMKNEVLPQVALKAILTPQNSFWTFSQLFLELMEEHQKFHAEESNRER